MRMRYADSFTSPIRLILNTTCLIKITKQLWIWIARSRRQIPPQIRARSFPKLLHRYVTSAIRKMVHKILTSHCLNLLIMSEYLQKMTSTSQDPIWIWMEAPSSAKAVHSFAWTSNTPKTLLRIQITFAAIQSQSNLQRTQPKRKKKSMSC
jgi:hypothetical protein